MKKIFLGFVISFLTFFATVTQADAAPLRIVALGDTGLAAWSSQQGWTQYAVGAAMNKWCGDNGCDLGMLLGDNFYMAGIDSCDDYHMAFEWPYYNLTKVKNINFVAALGNHDYTKFTSTDPNSNACTEVQSLGQGWYCMNWAHAQAQVNYTYSAPASCNSQYYSKKFLMPARYWNWNLGNILFMSLDTQPLVAHAWQDDPGFGNGSGKQINYANAQENQMVSAMQSSQATWKIAYGHHPYKSNGHHGNAGSYDGCSNTTNDEWNCGNRVKKLIESMCAKGLDLYLSGHDHSLQLISSKCDSANPGRDVQFVVSGGGSSKTGLQDNGNGASTRFQANELGFFYIVIDGNNLTLKAVKVDPANPNQPVEIGSYTVTK